MRVLPVSIFLSSPGDLHAERNGIKNRISLLQKNRGISSEFRLDLYAYEDDVPPVAGEPPQISVDRYLIDPADVDVLICMMWSKIGSSFTHPSTGVTYPSGTIYEFERAYERYRLTGRKPVILFYQCTRPSEGSAADLEAVRAFVARLQSPNGYQAIFHHRRFETQDELLSSIDRDLPQILRELNQPVRDDALRSSRDSLIAKIRSLWVDGFLESTFDSVPPLPVAYEYQSTSPTAALPEAALTGLSLKSHFRKSDCRLLMEARAGAGKSIALVQLLAYLIDEAVRDRTAKIPVIFDLSAWTGGSMRRWIVEELDRLYLVGRTAARRLIDNNELIYLFDGIEGLAEIADVAFDSDQNASNTIRTPLACLEAIDNFRTDVLGADTTEFSACVAARPESVSASETKQLVSKMFRSRITLMPLAIEESERYVDNEPGLEGLAQAVRADDVLRRLLVRPLFLHLMTIAYRDQPVSVVIGDCPPEQERIRDLLTRYCGSRLRSEVALASADHFSLRETRQALSWIASRQNRSLFLMELMQPEALGEGPQQSYRTIGSLILAILLGLFCSIPCATAAWMEWRTAHDAGVAWSKAIWLFVNAQSIVLIGGFLAFRYLRGWKSGIGLGVAFGAVRGLVVMQGAPDSPLPGSVRDGLVQGLITAAVTAPYFSVCLEVMKYQIDRIVPLRTFSWNWKRGLYGFLMGLLVGVLFWAFLGAARGISFGVAGAFIGSLLLSLNFAGVYVPVSVNQGIRRSVRTATLVAILATSVTFVAVTFAYSLATKDFGEGIENGVRGLSASVAWLMFGGVPVAQHYIFRVMAKRYYEVPLKLGAFLRFATKLHLLQQVGGAFSFRHELIRQYFSLQQER